MPKLLAAELAYYYSLGPFSDSGPHYPFNATIDLESGKISEGYPPFVEIYPSGLARSEPRTDFSEFALEFNEDNTATIRDFTIRQSITFGLPGADTSDPSFRHGWFVSPKFKLAYILYTRTEEPSGFNVAFVPVSGRKGKVTYDDVGFLYVYGDDINSTDRGRWLVYDDIQTAHADTYPGQGYILETHFYNDTFFEWRSRLRGLPDVFDTRSAIQYGDTVPEDTIIYRAVNGHECRDGDPYPEFYLWKVDLSTGAETRIDLTLFELQCAELSCCEDDCCGKGTRWNGQKCIWDLNSMGWNGDYSDSYIPDCTARRCCEAACCDDRTVWIEEIKSCFAGPPPSV